mgnify:FL=1
MATKKRKDSIVDKIMKDITIERDNDRYNYWQVKYKGVVVDEYDTDAVIENYLDGEEKPEDWEIENAIKIDFEDRIEKAFNTGGELAVKRLLLPFE